MIKIKKFNDRLLLKDNYDVKIVKLIIWKEYNDKINGI